MLAVCVHLGLPTGDYIAPEHPLQKRILTRVAELSGLAADEIILAEDGCGVPTFGMPLSAAARVFARLACDDGVGPRRIRAAMAAHPEMVRGPGDFNTELLRALGERIVAKSGAEALFCCGLREESLGVAVRIDDGSSRALPHVACAVLEQLDCLTPDDRRALPFATSEPVRNCHGHTVGQMRAAKFDVRSREGG